MITLLTLLSIVVQAIVWTFTAAIYIVGGLIGAVAGAFGVYGANDVKYTRTEQREKRFGFTDEEILATGLYPDDEGYKMSLISSILNK